MVAKIVKSIGAPKVQGAQKTADQAQQLQKLSFKDALLAQEVKLSAHAEKRLEQRSIEFAPGRAQQLADAVNKAAEKGSKESLIMMDKVALVVSITNRTVITAIDEDSLKDDVITNIDSAMILE